MNGTGGKGGQAKKNRPANADRLDDHGYIAHGLSPCSPALCLAVMTASFCKLISRYLFLP